MASTSHSHQNPWFPGFLERMACCALPPQNINTAIIVGDDDSSSSSSSEDVVVLESSTRQPVSQLQQLPSRRRPRGSDAATTGTGTTSINNSQQLPSPTFSPSRRELDRWDPSCIGVTSMWCTPSCAGSTATTASTMSDDNEGYYHDPEEIRSNATTQVVSHQKYRNNRTNQLLSSTLASAEQRLRKQLLEEEARSVYLKARRQQRGGPR